MSCARFEKMERGRGSREAWERHTRECPDCRAEAELDGRLSKEIGPMRTPLRSPELWDRIEKALRAEAEAGAKAAAAVLRPRRSRLPRILVPAAAAVLLAAAAVVFLAPRGPDPAAASGLLDTRALAKVDAQERAYVEAIEGLEKLARPRISAMDPALTSLYRDRLAVIDAQIMKCREALDRNPGNAHIRRYFLAALQDKKQTLAEALGS
jgi:hypothetical protein